MWLILVVIWVFSVSKICVTAPVTVTLTDFLLIFELVYYLIPTPELNNIPQITPYEILSGDKWRDSRLRCPVLFSCTPKRFLFTVNITDEVIVFDLQLSHLWWMHFLPHKKLDWASLNLFYKCDAQGRVVQVSSSALLWLQDRVNM